MLFLVAVALWYAVLSTVAFAVYAYDKRAAQARNRRSHRISERDLHLLALAGGWPGAWLAQQGLRHKTQKTRFRWMFFCMVLANCALLGLIVRFLI